MTPEERRWWTNCSVVWPGWKTPPGTRMPARIFRGLLEHMRHVPNFREYPVTRRAAACQKLRQTRNRHQRGGDRHLGTLCHLSAFDQGIARGSGDLKMRSQFVRPSGGT